MAFFNTKPNLPDTEKARIEFHLQQLAECIGLARFKLPVLSMKSLLELSQSGLSPNDAMGFFGEHLKHNVSGVELRCVPQQLEKCGGGG